MSTNHASGQQKYEHGGTFSLDWTYYSDIISAAIEINLQHVPRIILAPYLHHYAIS